MDYRLWCRIRTTRFESFFAFLSLTIFFVGAAATAGAGQSSPPPGHAMGEAPCVWAFPLKGADNQLDVATTISTLKDNGFSCVGQVITDQPPNTFDDFRRLLVAAQAAGISVWPVLIPPSEGGNSLPYKTDFVGWMKELAHLSLQYPVLRGVNIDDLMSGISPKTFTRPYLLTLYKAKQEINPNLLFVPTVYDLDQAVADRLAGAVDGVWFWWVNLEHNSGYRSHIENTRLVVANRFPVYGGVYAHSTSWHTEGAPAPATLKRSLQIACKYGDGAVIWLLPLAPNSSANELLKTARGFAPGGSEELAGKCGQGQIDRFDITVNKSE
jgi:hypothetical protein